MELFITGILIREEFKKKKKFLLVGRAPPLSKKLE